MGAQTSHDRTAALPLRADNHPLHTQPRPPAGSLVSLAVVVLGYLVALVGPSFVVSPTAKGAPGPRILLALGITVAGVLVAVVASLAAFRRGKNWSWLVIAVVPGFTLLVCGTILAGTKATSG